MLSFFPHLRKEIRGHAVFPFVPKMMKNIVERLGKIIKKKNREASTI